MTSGADLFVVCKQCGSEVSPYITECPYCGNRLRRRAPKLPRAHGSSLFTRGETQALVIATLGTKSDEQKIESLEGEYYKNFLLHYNFPSFSVGEVRRFGSPSRETPRFKRRVSSRSASSFRRIRRCS